MSQALGIYVSIPFCRAKCTYCNFASGVFGPERMDAYIDRLASEIAASQPRASALNAQLPTLVDSVFFGGGTPSLLSPAQLRRVFASLRNSFLLDPSAEITLECAPGQLEPETLDELLRLGLNRISFGVQSFADAESRAVGRTHTRELCLAEVERMRSAGLPNINLDLIVGLPHQTHASWLDSVHTAIRTGVPHLSVYMLEVDEDSRLGREVLAAGNRYGAATIPSEDQLAAWYTEACELLARNGIPQYEISNFARPGFASRHNLKYWQREPYLGFGLDAHSMLLTEASDPHHVAVRFANTDNLDDYLAPAPFTASSSPLPILSELPRSADRISLHAAFEEAVFLGLRLNCGIDLDELAQTFGSALVQQLRTNLADPESAGLLEDSANRLRLTPRGRILSNEVFGRVLISDAVSAAAAPA